MIEQLLLPLLLCCCCRGAEQLRSLTKSCLDENMAETAAYYATKLVTFSNSDREAVLLLAKVTDLVHTIGPAEGRECPVGLAASVQIDGWW